MTFKLTAKQEQANALLAGQSTHVMLFGGSRSGKTFLLTRAIVVRALKAPGSRHAMLRFRLGHIKQSLVMGTFPEVMALCFPGTEYELNKSDLYATIDTRNGPSEIWFGGLDDKERVEKILGNEYSTIYLNEASQIPWNSRNMAVTRLAQSVDQKIAGRPDRPLPLRMYYDCNPPDKAHWTYRLFVQKIDPETKEPLPFPDDYSAMQVNPTDNAENLPSGYIDNTLKGLSARLQKRFLLGEFKSANPNALFTDEMVDRWRILDQQLPDMQRIIVAVDPSGSDDTDNSDNDAIGLVVCGLGTDGVGYMLEDLTLKAGPLTWGKAAVNAYTRHDADKIVGEGNYGGAMVRSTIQSACKALGVRQVPFSMVTATRGKVVRAEPLSALVESGQIRFVGYHRDLEEELTSFTTNGYVGENSPNRADAFVWAMTELFPAMLKPQTEQNNKYEAPRYVSQGWLG